MSQSKVQLCNNSSRVHCWHRIIPDVLVMALWPQKERITELSSDMILTTEESGNSLFPVENPAEAKQSLSPLGSSKCSTTTTTTTTTKIPHSRIRLGGLGLYLEGHGWSYHHHIPSLPHHLYFFCQMGDHVISSSPFLGFIFRVS
jgi:hypothetical protein